MQMMRTLFSSLPGRSRWMTIPMNRSVLPRTAILAKSRPVLTCSASSWWRISWWDHWLNSRISPYLMSCSRSCWAWGTCSGATGTVSSSRGFGVLRQDGEGAEHPLPARTAGQCRHLQGIQPGGFPVFFRFFHFLLLCSFGSQSGILRRVGAGSLYGSSGFANRSSMADSACSYISVTISLSFRAFLMWPG